jgi:hypothetical protein
VKAIWKALNIVSASMISPRSGERVFKRRHPETMRRSYWTFARIEPVDTGDKVGKAATDRNLRASAASTRCSPRRPFFGSRRIAEAQRIGDFPTALADLRTNPIAITMTATSTRAAGRVEPRPLYRAAVCGR